MVLDMAVAALVYLDRRGASTSATSTVFMTEIPSTIPKHHTARVEVP